MRNMAFAAVAAFLLTSGAAMAETKTYDLANFDRIDIATGLTAVVKNGPTQSVYIESKKNGSLDQIDVQVVDGELRAKLNTNLLDIILSGGLLNMFGSENGATIYITLPELSGVSASSGAEVMADTVSGSYATVKSSSGAQVEIDAAKAGTLGLEASSGAELTIGGDCTELDLKFSSGAHILAQDLTTTDVRISGSSGGAARVTANGAVTGSISSGASMRVYGKPSSVEVKSSSGGDLSIR